MGVQEAGDRPGPGYIDSQRSGIGRLICPAGSRENGYVKSFNEKLGDEFLNVKIFYTPHEARVPVERFGALAMSDGTCSGGLSEEWEDEDRRVGKECSPGGPF